MIEKIINQLDCLITKAKQELAKEIDEKIRIGFESYKTNFIGSDKWCCEKMRERAKQIWNISDPKPHSSTGFMTLKFYGKDFVYCPFCGVKLF